MDNIREDEMTTNETKSLATVAGVGHMGNVSCNVSFPRQTLGTSDMKSKIDFLVLSSSKQVRCHVYKWQRAVIRKPDGLQVVWLVLACLAFACEAGSSQANAPVVGAPLFHWEAESLERTGTEVETIYAIGASGGKYCYLPKGQKEAAAPSKSSLIARFKAPPGRYLVRIRALAVNRGADSFFVVVDDQPRQNVGVPGQKEWVWREIAVVCSSTGEHTLVVSAREPSRIDAVEVVAISQESASDAVGLRQSTPVVLEPNGCRPLDINPPTFRWSGAWDRPYILQLAPAGIPWEQGREVTGIRETFYRPKDPLAVGKWKWRVRVGNDGWLPQQTFEVTENITRWPIPDWIELYQRFACTHPRILFRAGELPQLRAKASGLMKDLAGEWARQMKKTLGAKLTLEEDKPSQKMGDHKAATLQRVASKKDAGKMMDPVEPLAFLAVVLNRDDFAQEAIRRAMAATKLDPKGYTSQKVSDFSNGAIVRSLAQVYDLLYDRLTVQERQAIHASLRARVLDVYRPEMEQRLYNAHGWQHVFMDLAHGPLALWDEDPEMAEWLRWALKMTVSFYPWYGGSDGASEEGGSYFTGTDMNTSLRMARFWDTACGLDLSANPWFRNDPWYVIYSCPLSGPVSRFGDHPPEVEPPSIARAMAALIQANRYGHPFAAAYANAIVRQSGEEAFSHEGPANSGFAAEWLRKGPLSRTEKKPLTELPPAHVFPQTGLAFIHNAFAQPNRNVMFEFRSSPYGAFNHAHADQNSFNICAYGDELILDAGHYTSYGDDHHFGYTVKQKAHNLILVDQQDEPSRELAAYGQVTGFGQGADWAWVMGDAREAYYKTPLARFNRQCVWLRGEDVQNYVIFDSIAAQDGKPHRYEWLLHAANKPEINASGQSVLVSTKRAQAHVTWLTPCKLQYELTDKFDPPAENWRPDRQSRQYPNQWHLSVRPPTPSPAAEFLTVIQVGPRGVNASLPLALEDPRKVRIGEWQLVFTIDTFTLTRAGKQIYVGEMGSVNEAGSSDR